MEQFWTGALPDNVSYPYSPQRNEELKVGWLGFNGTFSTNKAISCH